MITTQIFNTRDTNLLSSMPFNIAHHFSEITYDIINKGPNKFIIYGHMTLPREVYTFLTSSDWAEYTSQDNEIQEFSPEMFRKINNHYWNCYRFTPLKLKRSEDHKGDDEVVLYTESKNFPVFLEEDYSYQERLMQYLTRVWK